MYFDKRLCMFHQIFATQDELFETMFKTMFQAGVVKSDYLEGIKEREEEYPTGLLINDIGFAIPHTDSSKVNYSQICFASLNQPVEFLNMGDKNEKIKVELVFMLAMSWYWFYWFGFSYWFAIIKFGNSYSNNGRKIW